MCCAWEFVTISHYDLCFPMQETNSSIGGCRGGRYMKADLLSLGVRRGGLAGPCQRAARRQLGVGVGVIGAGWDV